MDCQFALCAKGLTTLTMELPGLCPPENGCVIATILLDVRGRAAFLAHALGVELVWLCHRLLDAAHDAVELLVDGYAVVDQATDFGNDFAEWMEAH
ncbi:MAG TPA: hypothetical protein VH187_05480 [Scandinavium sp.]|uniref:hypothetical protein n=1 Tax=Scandinavium sp. TaxID=2830653 RepID=UPI002E337380|nr:hypothetical protein [Scandinavium sp.]HEX4500612.1 hypothetical protein [Scandinavium sp.]